jgi:hypothetical protein
MAASHNDQDHLAQEGCSRLAVAIGSAVKSPSHANTLINLTLVDPGFLTGALICAHLQPHGLYHAGGRLEPPPLQANTFLPAIASTCQPSLFSTTCVRGRCCRARV